MRVRQLVRRYSAHTVAHTRPLCIFEERDISSDDVRVLTRPRRNYHRRARSTPASSNGLCRDGETNRRSVEMLRLIVSRSLGAAKNYSTYELM